MKREKDIEAWEDEIRILMQKVEEKCGTKITAETLAESIAYQWQAPGTGSSL